MLVKKYGNRRLYDTEESRYITLDELTTKIQKGAEPRVIDAKTGDDLTQTTLTQIVMESRGAAKFLPIPLLTQLIRLDDAFLSEFLGRYVTAALELYLHARQGARTLAPWNPFAMLPFTATSALARLANVPVGWAEDKDAPPPAPEAPAPEVSPPAPRSEVDELRRELEALKRSLQKRRK